MSAALFNHTINEWINCLDKYDFIELCTRPSEKAWSLAQVYMHILDESDYHIEQIKACIASNDNAEKQPSAAAQQMLANNDFPDEAIDGPFTNIPIPFPPDKEYLRHRLIRLQENIDALSTTIEKTSFSGKTRHPGLHYFNAPQWLQFAEMHFRHHLRQKNRLEEFLKSRK